MTITNEQTTTTSGKVIDLGERETTTVVNILGLSLVNILQDIRNSQETCTSSSETATFLTQRSLDDKDGLYIHCLMTGFMAVYLTFIELVLSDSFHDFMRLFSPYDSLLSTPFVWYYYKHHVSLLCHLRIQLDHLDISITSIDTIISKFYTHYFLETSAQKHQKDHGQYYTPKPVIQFMWEKVIASRPLLVHYGIPRIFDPCLGIGSFLCEYIHRLIEQCRRDVWNDAERLAKLLTQDIPESIWGVEIDPFTYHLCKLNMMVHLFPIYQRLNELQLSLPSHSINRLRLFCNDTLTLRCDDGNQDAFEKDCLNLLRDPSKLKFHYIVTNPPYMIRKTGFITQPDPTLYDLQTLGGRGTQAYVYFMWAALQRIDDQLGQVCLITPSQWTILEFAQHFREWILMNCKLLDMYEFEPYKIWPKVQTDSLIFRICKRTSILDHFEYTLYLRNKARNTPLADLLQQYRDFNPLTNCNPQLQFRYSFCLKSCKGMASFAFILPTTSCLDELNRLTGHLPRLCDGEGKRDGQAPLVWHRGPNTNPVYALVVRTAWARHKFGDKVCQQWLKPCFYWNGKSGYASTGGGKEGEFWKTRDPLRLIKKEASAAEAYWPYRSYDEKESFYSLIMINREDADYLRAQSTEDESYAVLYNYLHEARLSLQANKNDKDIVYCQYSKCGTEYPVKIVHPINCGYYSRTQPRQRFFIDTTQIAVTNQCIYFTIQPSTPWQDYDYFCGILNCTLLQYFTKVYCSYDQQGRMRFFGRSMATIPFAPPPSARFMHELALFVQSVTFIRTWLYTFIRHTHSGQRLMERVRSYEWRLDEADKAALSHYDTLDIRPDADLASFSCWQSIQWIDDFVQRKRGDAFHCFVVLLKIASLFQFAIDQMAYYAYGIPLHLQLEVEKELQLISQRREWSMQIREQEYNEENWSSLIINTAKSLVD
ncbi:uncharacterized protein RHIMIDRAFT_239538 [Rhizopus microsporus ATCC 52813]|uniref:site-specific DNA-methyltransferase (adenine-specific) n=1 Tax=Rhizopus microsporus ATCC 52813 TaxID=1340429 RepID=A0A2G4SQQ9_RHIZD|nr:uncharacterized protein RHIMIDRAFT_239538 [Rhizopus microsporus ATCC 52813]PHZ10716.1 hypothetical protein RHIMIDRAFT_239538 [Rhizopus microsporus ATCC 52813]